MADEAVREGSAVGERFWWGAIQPEVEDESVRAVVLRRVNSPGTIMRAGTVRRRAVSRRQDTES